MRPPYCRLSLPPLLRDGLRFEDGKSEGAKARPVGDDAEFGDPAVAERQRDSQLQLTAVRHDDAR